MVDVVKKFGKKRLEILRSAAAAFHRRGYHGASVDAIARAMDMTKGNLYYYFKDKQDILFVCHDYSLDLLLKMLRQVESSPLTTQEKLRQVILGFVNVTIDELRGTTLMLDVEGLSADRLRKIVRKRDSFDRGIRRIIQAGMDEGTFRKGDAKLMTFAILGALNWITRWYDPRGAASHHQIGDAFADYLVSGLLADQAPAVPAPHLNPADFDGRTEAANGNGVAQAKSKTV